MNQYDILIVNLDPAVGSEIKKTRPCLVISPDEMNLHLNTVVIAPVTSKSKDYPTRVSVYIDNHQNWVVIDQIRTIDKKRIVKNLGKITFSEIKMIKEVIHDTYVAD